MSSMIRTLLLSAALIVAVSSANGQSIEITTDSTDLRITIKRGLVQAGYTIKVEDMEVGLMETEPKLADRHDTQRVARWLASGMSLELTARVIFREDQAEMRLAGFVPGTTGRPEAVKPNHKAFKRIIVALEDNGATVTERK